MKKWIFGSLTALLIITPCSYSYAEGIGQNLPPAVEHKELTYEDYRNAVIDSLKAIESDNNKENIEASIETFFKLPSLDVYPNYLYQDDKYTFSDQILMKLDEISSTSVKSELDLLFVRRAMNTLEKTRHFFDFGVADKAIKRLSPSDERTKYEARFSELQTIVFDSIDSDYIDWLNPPDNLVVDENWQKPDDQMALPEGTNDHMAPGGEANQKPTLPESPKPEKYDRTEIRYITEGNKCYKVFQHYKNGKVVKEDKQTPDKFEQIFCNAGSTGHPISDGHHNSFPNAGSGSYHDTKLPQITFDGFDPYNPEMMNQVREKEEEKKLTKPITIQYTFNKTSESPYYHDTGIAIGEDKLLSYEQAKDALHQIAIQAKGKYVDDADQVLGLIEGKIVVLKNKKIKFDDFAEMFNNTTVGVRSLDTRSGKQVYLADLVETKGITTITIDGEEIILEARPIVDNSIVLFPVSQIAEKLGGSVTEQGSKTIIENKKHTLVFEEGNPFIIYDKNEVNIFVPTRRNNEGVLMAPIRALVESFDKSLEVHSETSKVLIQ
ncbi:copper amine oxidase N-terminal domain-containing protein (plasmid) [Paenibacillus thiaminolyticus]|uniref:stalk domain-containing protein n=1 Tax=Paenibacillus thiaminolyticus TaxID=49283 RepID=UPI00232F2FEF|nr:stalk domain-containing protein [Paenibacillus thiaminolyticus]WCF11386.1 copper amine oxidase N-terminal domain-containing protein [Paenibacillus thiaminolyticus]